MFNNIFSYMWLKDIENRSTQFLFIEVFTYLLIIFALFFNNNSLKNVLHY